MRHIGLAVLALLLFGSVAQAAAISISFPSAMSAKPLDGRIILMLSRDLGREPRSHVSPDNLLDAPFMFGVNANGWVPGATVTIDDKAFGWPTRRLSDLPPGDYLVQAVLNRYETFHLADGRVLKLPPDKGEGQQWTNKPGNLYSAPIRIHVDPHHAFHASVSLAAQNPPIRPKPDTEFVRHIQVRSELLSRFWGRDMSLGAWVLVPKDFDKHPQSHFPLMVFHGHFPGVDLRIPYGPA